MNDAPWIRETERTGHCSTGWWNTPPLLDDSFSCDRCGDKIEIGDEYFDFDGSCLCRECFENLTKSWRKRRA